MPELVELSLVELSQEIEAGTLSPHELLHSVLARIDQVESTVKAFASRDVERAQKDAAALTEELASKGPRSKLHGIPIGVKDVIDVEGLPTRAGSHVLDDEPIPGDAPVIARLRQAGAVILGKTTTHEFACGVTTAPTRNPWDPSRIPGGSSGGSGAALSASECIGALGTDSGGSIRVPAAFCGVCGLRPRKKTVPMEGIIPFSWTHDTCGPLGRSAEDLALMWRVMSGDEPVTTDRPAAGLRIGVLHPLRSMLECMGEVEQATYAAADVLESHGAKRHDIELPPFEEWDIPRAKVVASDMLAAHQEAGWFPGRADRYSEEARAFLERGLAITGADLTLARRKLEPLGERYLAVFDRVDVVLVPTAIRSAPTIAEAVEKAEPGKPPPLVPDIMRATGPVGWCGLVAVSVPTGFANDGLPVGLQFVARDESTALSAAARFQAVTDHHNARPPLEPLVAN
jgi:aspartyl-tRNA(Asn)/glutamyl-tRNA(Gln) amidotransferase subunit A